LQLGRLSTLAGPQAEAGCEAPEVILLSGMSERSPLLVAPSLTDESTQTNCTLTHRKWKQKLISWLGSLRPHGPPMGNCGIGRHGDARAPGIFRVYLRILGYTRFTRPAGHLGRSEGQGVPGRNDRDRPINIMSHSEMFVSVCPVALPSCRCRAVYSAAFVSRILHIWNSLRFRVSEIFYAAIKLCMILIYRAAGRTPLD